MRTIQPVTKYIKDVKRLQRRGYDLAKLNQLITALATDQPLPPSARPHKLAGQQRDVWDVHIAPDWILLYEINPQTVTLVRTGTHADLF